jgi:glycoprotein endo-alpha-1,2-mannosidase
LIRFSRYALFFCALLTAALVLNGCATPSSGKSAPIPKNGAVHTFYYGWYGNPEVDGSWRQWNHQVFLKEGGGRRHVPPEDIGSTFYPADGLYSSNDPEALDRQMAQMKRAGIDVAVATWWGPNDYTDRSLPLLFDAAEDNGVKIAFHIEPFAGRNAAGTKKAVEYLLNRFGSRPALYRDAKRGNRPYFYIYDSYRTPADNWATVFAPDGAQTIRGTAYDAVFIGLWVKEEHSEFMEVSQFDGFYTYFATEGFTYGSTQENWPAMAQWAKEHNKIFIPCVGPGYDDLRIRPWNGANQRAREKGAYYDRAFQAALEVEPGAIGVTSWNEWHEGTQIEAAVPKKTTGHTYLDHEGLGSNWYLKRTRHWVDRWNQK